MTAQGSTGSTVTERWAAVQFLQHPSLLVQSQAEHSQCSGPCAGQATTHRSRSALGLGISKQAVGPVSPTHGAHLLLLLLPHLHVPPPLPPPPPGMLDKYGVELIGAKLPSIDRAEDRELFKQAMQRIGLKTPPRWVCFWGGGWQGRWQWGGGGAGDCRGGSVVRRVCMGRASLLGAGGRSVCVWFDCFGVAGAGGLSMVGVGAE
jgi:hypothetical protein